MTKSAKSPEGEIYLKEFSSQDFMDLFKAMNEVILFSKKVKIHVNSCLESFQRENAENMLSPKTDFQWANKTKLIMASINETIDQQNQVIVKILKEVSCLKMKLTGVSDKLSEKTMQFFLSSEEIQHLGQQIQELNHLSAGLVHLAEELRAQNHVQRDVH